MDFRQLSVWGHIVHMYKLVEESKLGTIETAFWGQNHYYISSNANLPIIGVFLYMNFPQSFFSFKSKFGLPKKCIQLIIMMEMSLERPNKILVL